MRLDKFLKALSNEIEVRLWEASTDKVIALDLSKAKKYKVVWFKPVKESNEIVLDVMVVRKEED